MFVKCKKCGREFDFEFSKQCHYCGQEYVDEGNLTHTAAETSYAENSQEKNDKVLNPVSEKDDKGVNPLRKQFLTQY